MKRHFYKIMMAAAAMLPVFASCTEEPIQPAEPENDSYGVYFETLTSAQKSVEFDPADEPVLTFKAFRTKEDGAITVPISLKATGNEADATSVFVPSALTFEDGQLETEFSVSFPTAELGITYTCNVTCNDPQYVKIYSQKPTAFSFEVTRVKWNPVVGANGEEFGSWTDDILSSLFGLAGKFSTNDKIVIYEREDKPGYYRIPDVYNPYMLAKFWKNQYPEEEFEENCTPGTFSYIDATNPDKVWLPVQSTGAVIGSDGYISFASLCSENGFSGNSVYGTMKNGVIRFPAKSVLVDFSVSGGWYYANSSEKLVIVLPGCKDNDYSLSLQTLLSEDGELPFKITVGADLAKVNYKFFEGKISAADLPFSALDVARDEKAEYVTETSVLYATLPKTGVYTLIATGLDADGNMQVYKSTEVSYVAADDEVPVVITCGIGSAAKYVPKGYSTDNTVEVYAYGENLVDVKLYVASRLDIISNLNGCIEALLKQPSVSGDVLDLINGEGYAGPVTKLLPGTEYVLLVYASNGYEEDLFMSDETVFTTGDPLPIYQSFDDVDEDLLPETKAGYYGSYNLYAISKDNKTGLREYVTTITISDGGVAGEGESTMDLVKIENFWGAAADYIGIDDTMYMEYYDGVLYLLSNFFGATGGNLAGYYAANLTGFSGGYLGASSSDYSMYSGFVLDGYSAFFTNSSKYAFDTIGLFLFGDEACTQTAGYLEKYQDILFVDATKDDNMKKSASAAPASLSLKSEPALKVTPNGLVKGTRSNLRSDVSLYGIVDGVVGTPSVKAADATVSNYTGKGFDEVLRVKF